MCIDSSGTCECECECECDSKGVGEGEWSARRKWMLRVTWNENDCHASVRNARVYMIICMPVRMAVPSDYDLPVHVINQHR